MLGHDSSGDAFGFRKIDMPDNEQDSFINLSVNSGCADQLAIHDQGHGPGQVAGNLAMVAFARQWGQVDGQVFVFFVMTVAAAEVAVGLALIVITLYLKTRGGLKWLVGGIPAIVATPTDVAAHGFHSRHLLYIHGGGYMVGSPRSHIAMASRLARLIQARATTRLLFVDNIRVLLTVLVLLHHLPRLFDTVGDGFLDQYVLPGFERFHRGVEVPAAVLVAAGADVDDLFDGNKTRRQVHIGRRHPQTGSIQDRVV